MVEELTMTEVSAKSFSSGMMYVSSSNLDNASSYAFITELPGGGGIYRPAVQMPAMEMQVLCPVGRDLS